jgi:hypothetical protein
VRVSETVMIQIFSEEDGFDMENSQKY